MTGGNPHEGGAKTLHWMHETEDGPIHLQVTKAPGRGWAARVWGCQLQGVGTCRSYAQARRLLLKCFAEMYPKHRCGKGCEGAPQETPLPRKLPVARPKPTRKGGTAR